MNADNAGRIAELEREKRRLQEDHERLTTRIIATVAETDRESALDAIADEEITRLVEQVRQIGKHRDRRREIKKAIAELV